jgi:diguanylate cyclase (GGDEF)-like protein
LALGEDFDRPYLEVLARAGLTVRRFPDADRLIAAAGSPAPLAVVVDLDALEPPLPDRFARIKAAYPSSELIAVSSTDSSRLAMLCLRSGFGDFLLKPVSPEQLAWTLEHCLRRRELVERWNEPRGKLLGTLLGLSACGSGALVRLEALKYLREVWQARGAGWLSGGSRPRWLATVPAPDNRDPAPHRPRRCPARTGLFRNARTRQARVVLARPRGGAVLVWGIAGKVTKRQMREGLAVIQHAELCLRNLDKLERIQKQTFVDDLTSLYNSRYLKHCLTQSVARSRRSQLGFSVLFIDLDRFKGVNDRYGHTVGSGLLVAIAKTLKGSLRSKDPIFRYGGDEFVVILQNTALEKAYEVAERLRNTIEKKVFYVRGHPLHVTISVGIAVYPDHAPEQQTLLRLADEAMYAAKKQTRNAVQLAVMPAPAAGLPAEEAVPAEPKLLDTER